MPRTFIAIPIDPIVQKRLSQLATDLDWSGADIKWVANGRFHMTLRFLGNISEELVTQICERLPALYADIAIIPVAIDHLGAFPTAARPKVLWAGLSEQSDMLDAIHHRLQEGLRQLGIPEEERAFSAHITLGRVRRLKKGHSLKQTLSTYRFEPPLQQSLSQIVFYESTLTPEGPVYTALQKVSLKDSFTPLE